MSDADFLDKLHDQVIDCVDKCDEAWGMLREHDGRVARKVRRMVETMAHAAWDALTVIEDAKEKPSATVHLLRPEL